MAPPSQELEPPANPGRFTALNPALLIRGLQARLAPAEQPPPLRRLERNKTIRNELVDTEIRPVPSGRVFLLSHRMYLAKVLLGRGLINTQPYSDRLQPVSSHKIGSPIPEQRQTTSACACLSQRRRFGKRRLMLLILKVAIFMRRRDLEKAAMLTLFHLLD
jgi:hypothetical protein